MIKTSEAYRAAIVGSPRRIEVLAVVDISDPDMVDLPVTSTELAPWSDTALLYDHGFASAPRLALLEDNYWLLDGETEIEGETEPTSAALCGEDCIFSTPVWFQRNFSGVEVLQACSVFFPTDVMAGVPETFTVDIYEGSTVRYTQIFAGNRASQVSLTGFTVNAPTAIRVTVTRWSLPYRRARCVEILPGVYEQWDGDMLASFMATLQGDVSALSLPYGSVTLAMDNSSRRFEPRSKDGVFQSITDRQGVEVYIGVQTASGTVERCPLGVFYQYGDGWKTGDNDLTMEWYLVDIIGLLAARDFIAPATLPTTLSGWLAALCAQLGSNFAARYKVDPAYADAPVTVRSAELISGATCGDILKWVCQASGTWPRADASTGYLTAEPLWSQGNRVTLDDLVKYPTLKANDDVSALIFALGDEDGTRVVVGGTASGGMTVSIANPFLQTEAAALTAARQMLSCYGGNRIELTGRGDPSGEIGDVDTVWLDERQATTARRVRQDFRVSGGVLRNCRSSLIQPDGSYLYQSRTVLTESGTWTAPAGVTQLRVILVGHGGDGADGADGSYDAAGEAGADGAGGRVWAGTIAINDGQTFAVDIGDATTLGAYSSANGSIYPYGYTDISSGDSYARSGVADPLPGSGDGGAGGAGGAKGNKTTRRVRYTDDYGNTVYIPEEIVSNVPGVAGKGVPGVAGCAVIYWDKEATS